MIWTAKLRRAKHKRGQGLPFSKAERASSMMTTKSRCHPESNFENQGAQKARPWRAISGGLSVTCLCDRRSVTYRTDQDMCGWISSGRDLTVSLLLLLDRLSYSDEAE